MEEELELGPRLTAGLEANRAQHTEGVSWRKAVLTDMGAQLQLLLPTAS